MFALNLRRLYYVCDKYVIRNLRNKKPDIGPNPGLNKRIGAFREEGLKIEDNDAEEFFEQSDANFYNVGQAYSEHMNETLIGKHNVRHHIIKEKYFKENMPNLLTWSEKEQIRHLINTQPDEWTPEKIAESFPVTTQVVKKLVKFPWKPANEERIARHDASAMRNWRQLEEGTLDIPSNLREHFLKFSKRTIPPLNRKSIKDDLTQEEKLGEFARIIQRCAQENGSEQAPEDMHSDSNVEDEVKPKRDNKRVTLDQLTMRIKKRVEGGSEINLPDKILLDSISVNTSEGTEGCISKEIELDKKEASRSTESNLTEYKQTEQRVFSDGNYPQRIRIPKKAFKRGATYKINDCFYDDDGRFLYRVIGMTKN